MQMRVGRARAATAVQYRPRRARRNLGGMAVTSSRLGRASKWLIWTRTSSARPSYAAPTDGQLLASGAAFAGFGVALPCPIAARRSTACSAACRRAAGAALCAPGTTRWKGRKDVIGARACGQCRKRSSEGKWDEQSNTGVHESPWI